MTELFRELLRAREIAQDLGRVERNYRKKHGWNYYDSPIESYEETFKEVVSPSIKEFLESRRNRGLSNVVLDLMSPAGFISELPIDSGLAVTLGDRRSKKLRAEDRARGTEVLEANILTKKCWKDIENWLGEKEVSGFSLIICRPVMGATNIPKDYNLAYFLLNRAWGFLDTGGALLTETRYLDDNLVRNYTELLKLNSIDAKMSSRAESGILHQGSLGLVKTPQSSVNLPTMNLSY